MSFRLIHILEIQDFFLIKLIDNKVYLKKISVDQFLVDFCSAHEVKYKISDFNTSCRLLSSTDLLLDERWNQLSDWRSVNKLITKWVHDLINKQRGDWPCVVSWVWALSSQPTESITFLKRDWHTHTDRKTLKEEFCRNIWRFWRSLTSDRLISWLANDRRASMSDGRNSLWKASERSPGSSPTQQELQTDRWVFISSILPDLQSSARRSTWKVSILPRWQYFNILNVKCNVKDFKKTFQWCKVLNYIYQRLYQQII